MPKRWLVRPHDRSLVAALEQSAGVSSIVAALLVTRGITEAAAARAFLSAGLSDLRDPESLPGVPEAADRILAAARAGRSIVVHGDYDADGMCGTAILMGCLEALGGRVSWYVPDRLKDGYGLKSQAVEALAADGCGMIVTVDCGITAVEAAARARCLGVELVVTDHHHFDEPLPAADVIVHPRLPGTAYPFGDLCGAGVAFKLAWAIATRACGSKQVSPRFRAMLLKSIGLAALGTVADVVPLLDENRIFVKHSLSCLRDKGGPGITKLIEVAGLGDRARIDSEDVAFKLAPRLNAAGRMGYVGCGIELLTTSDDARADTLATFLHELNAARETEERSIVLAATRQAKEHFDPDHDPALVLAERGWHQGVIGIVAGRLVERFHRPVVMIAKAAHDGLPATGSVRSVPGLDVRAALASCGHLLVGFGGHEAAAGLQIEERRIDAFRERFLAAVHDRLPAAARVPQVMLDGETTLAGLTLDTVEQIERLAPFGQGNRRPVLCASAVSLCEPPRAMGGGKHLALQLVQHGSRIRGVAFGAAEWLPSLPSPGQPFHVAFKPKINDYRGRRTAEMEIIDWRPAGIDLTVEVVASTAPAT